MFIRKNLMKYVSDSDISFNDAITLNLSNGYKIFGIYIPPSTSKYYGDHIDFLESVVDCANEANLNVIVCGDLNSRIGDMDTINEYSYSKNPDAFVNQHGRQLIKIFNLGTLVPLNHLKHNGMQFGGGFTFKRGEAQSQNDWMLCNKKCLPSIRMLSLHRDYDNISDHIPVSIQFETQLDVSLMNMKRSITDMLQEPNNHSKRLKINQKRINKDTLQRLVYHEMENFVYDENNVEKALGDLRDVFYVAAKGSKIPDPSVKLPRDEEKDNITISMNNEFEHNSWRTVVSSKDPKLLWEKIDWSGKMKSENIESENDINDFADFIEKRCSLPAEHSYFSDLTTDKVDPVLDAPITSEEILATAKEMKSTNKSKCGIPVPVLMMVIYAMINVLTTLFNKVFFNEYPDC